MRIIRPDGSVTSATGTGGAALGSGAATNLVGVWTSASSIGGVSGFSFASSLLSVPGAIAITGSSASPGGSTRYIGPAGSASNTRINVPTGGEVEIAINDSVVAKINSSGQIVSNVADGTPPFIITSTTQVNNLNVASVGGTSLSGLVQNTVTLTAGEGLSGGGDLSANRSFALDINDLSTSLTAVDTADLVAVADASASNTVKKSTVNQFLSGITTFTALTGAGTDAADLFFIYDSDAGLMKKITRAELASVLGGGGGGGGGVDVSGTPTTGQYARWVDADTVEGVSVSTLRTDISAAQVDGDGRLLFSQFPSNWNAIRYVKLATTTTSVGTYNATGGSSGRGQITSAVNTVDGTTLTAGDRILIFLTVNGDYEANGIWEVTTVGTGSDGVWDRAEDFDADNKVGPGLMVFVSAGDILRTSLWVLYSWAPLTVGGASGSELYFAQVPFVSAIQSVVVPYGPDSYTFYPAYVANDEFNTGTLDTTGTRFSGAEAWTWLNQGPTTATQSYGGLVLAKTYDSGEWTFIFQNSPSTPWKYRCKITLGGMERYQNYYSAGLAVRNSSNQRITTISLAYINGHIVRHARGDADHGSSTIWIADKNVLDVSRQNYLELEHSGTELITRWSPTGHDGTFQELGRENVTTHHNNPIGTVNQIGLGIQHDRSADTGEFYAIVDWFRRIS